MKHHRQNNFSILKCLGGIIHDEMNAKWRNNAALYHAKCFSEQKGEERKIGPLLIVKFRRWTKDQFVCWVYTLGVGFLGLHGNPMFPLRRLFRNPGAMVQRDRKLYRANYSCIQEFISRKNRRSCSKILFSSHHALLACYY